MNNTKIKRTILAAFAAFSFTACAATHSASEQKPVVFDKNAPGETTVETTREQLDEAASGAPTESLARYKNAVADKDTENIKAFLSKKSLEMIRAAADAKNVELDEYLKNGDGTFLKDAVEFQNERIEGSEATVETRDPAKVAWVKIPRVKENNEWRLAIDKIFDDLGAADDMKCLTTTTVESPSSDTKVSRSKTKTASGVNKTITITKSSDSGDYSKKESEEFYR